MLYNFVISFSRLGIPYNSRKNYRKSEKMICNFLFEKRMRNTSLMYCLRLFESKLWIYGHEKVQKLPGKGLGSKIV